MGAGPFYLGGTIGFDRSNSGPFDDCGTVKHNLGLARDGRARVAASGSVTMPVATAGREVEFALTGQDGSPQLEVFGPHGEHYVDPGPGHPGLVSGAAFLHSPTGDTTIVALPSPTSRELALPERSSDHLDPGNDALPQGEALRPRNRNREPADAPLPDERPPRSDDPFLRAGFRGRPDRAGFRRSQRERAVHPAPGPGGKRQSWRPSCATASPRASR